MAGDQGGTVSVLPMGSLFDLCQMLMLELPVLRLRDIKGESEASMRRRHRNGVATCRAARWSLLTLR